VRHHSLYAGSWIGTSRSLLLIPGLALLAFGILSDAAWSATDLALNPSRLGYPSPVSSNAGWGGGSDKWAIVDGRRSYNSWANGLAFTGGRGNWLQPAGPRQATIEFGRAVTFNEVIIWHHGIAHTPADPSLSYWDGSSWFPIQFTRNYGTMHEEGQNSGYSTSDIYVFTPVTGSAIRYSFDNRLANIDGSQIEHGWIYAFEVYRTCASISATPWKQGGGEAWAPDLYDHSGTRMSTSGCAVTACAMLIDSQGGVTNPGELNSALKQAKDGYKGPAINWVKVAEYARNELNLPLYFRMRTNVRTPTTDSLLDQSLCEGIPVVLNVGSVRSTCKNRARKDHFVLATAADTTAAVPTWHVLDPASDSCALTTVSDYDDMRLFSKTGPRHYYAAGATSTIEVLVTDPTGRRTGFEPATGAILREIPRSEYETWSLGRDDDDVENGELKDENVVDIFEPMDGVYVVQAIGRTAGEYTIHFFAYDTEQNPVGIYVINSRTAPGATQTYITSYSSEPGSVLKLNLVVSVDVKPGDIRNTVNPRSGGGIPVAILTTDTFDATSIDPASIAFGPRGASEVHGRGHLEDVDGDSDLDMVVHFSVGESGIICGDTSAEVVGYTFDNIAIVGSDSIITVGCK